MSSLRLVILCSVVVRSARVPGGFPRHWKFSLEPVSDTLGKLVRAFEEPSDASAHPRPMRECLTCASAIGNPQIIAHSTTSREQHLRRPLARTSPQRNESQTYSSLEKSYSHKHCKCKTSRAMWSPRTWNFLILLLKSHMLPAWQR